MYECVSFSQHNEIKGRKVLYSKKYLCQLSSLHKKAHSVRNEACRATILLRLLAKPLRCSMTKNPNAFEGWAHPTFPNINTHLIHSAEKFASMILPCSHYTFLFIRLPQIAKSKLQLFVKLVSKCVCVCVCVCKLVSGLVYDL